MKSRNSALRTLVVATMAALTVLTPGRAWAQDTAAFLRWRNGDVVPGQLLESGAGQIRWGSPLFWDELEIDAAALDSVAFRKRSVPSTRAFRIVTVSGDVFAADVVGSDAETFLLSTERLGQVRVKRDAIYSWDRRAHANLVFDASQASFWGVAVPKGPIKDLAYRIYDGSNEWPRWMPGQVPELSRLIPADEGVFEAGFLDLGLTQLTEAFAMVFAGQLEATQESEYTFALSSRGSAKVYVDGSLIGLSSTARDAVARVRLGTGYHALRVEYGKTPEDPSPALTLTWAGPGFSEQSLVGINPPSGWRRSLAGHLHTERSRSPIFRGLELPEAFEMELELTSAESPRFVFALGGDASNLALSPQPLRLETWDNELVLVQDNLFESVLTLTEDQREVRVRLAFDAAARELRVFDPAGRPLTRVHGIQATTGRAGLFLRNRGKDLTLRLLRVYRPSVARATQPVDRARPRVHLMDGRTIYGHLEVGDGGAAVVDDQGQRRDIELGAIDRIVRPAAVMAPATDGVEVDYADGAILRGRIERVSSDRVVLRTAFSPAPVTCTLAGALSLRLASTAKDGAPASGDCDRLFFASGRLQGRLSFDRAGAPLSWRPEGVAQAVRLRMPGGARVERHAERVAKQPSYDGTEFPHVLHLKNGEVIPGAVTSYDQSRLGFRSPFFSPRELESAHLKAIEFPTWKRPDPEAAPTAKGPDGRPPRLGLERSLTVAIDPVRLERALTVPRQSRQSPPSHLLVAKSGDIKRGTLQSILGDLLQFESKLEPVTVPIGRLARVVEVSPPREAGGPLGGEPASGESLVRATLADGSVLIFEALESGEGTLRGRSPIYGAVAVPIDNLQRLTLGGFEREQFKSPFASWVVRPAQEPELRNTAPPTRGAAVVEDPSARAAAPLPRGRTDSAGNAGGAAVPAAPGRGGPAVVVQSPRGPVLGLVRVDAADRSVRFPVSINQRAGLVEYAVVTDDGKTHESVFRTAAEPTHVHLGLLLLGGKPAYARELPTDLAQALPGEPVLIDVAWVEEGVEIVRPLADFIVTANDAAPLTPGPWVYNGSVMVGNGLTAQSDGSIVSLRLDPDALINNPRPGRGDDELHRPNVPALPAQPAGLQMILRLAKDRRGQPHLDPPSDSNLPPSPGKP